MGQTGVVLDGEQHVCTGGQEVDPGQRSIRELTEVDEGGGLVVGVNDTDEVRGSSSTPGEQSGLALDRRRDRSIDNERGLAVDSTEEGTKNDEGSDDGSHCNLQFSDRKSVV